MIRKLAAGWVVAVLAMALTVPVLADHDGNTNTANYWKAHYPNAVACYKYDPPGTPTVHGFLTQKDGNEYKAVQLNPFNQAWPGDRWEVLIVNGGPEGDAVYELPTAGVDYYTPGLNARGKHYGVSHWIVCKGQTPTTTTTVEDTTTTTVEDTTTTTEGSTTTTEQETTTTTEQESTTTTVPDSTTTTVEDSTTTTVEDTTTSTEPSTTTNPATPTVTTPPALPFTGPADWLIPGLWTAVGMIIIGSVLAWVFRDRLTG